MHFLHIKRRSFYLAWLAVTLTAGVFLITQSNAAPVVNSITSGDASVSTSSNDTLVTQTSQSATIDWDSFNLTANESITFNQPSSSAVAINNILDSNPSQIFGSINANGRVVLLNPNGFYFGATSSVSAHTFIAAAVSAQNATYNNSTGLITILNPASTADITLAGTINANTTQLYARTINTPQGASINTPTAGYVSIRSAKDITIGGTITAPQGTIDIFALGGTATATQDATISTKNDNYDHSLAPGFIEFSGKRFVFEDHSWPFELNSQDTLLLDPDIINIESTACGSPGTPACPTLDNTNRTVLVGLNPDATSTVVASQLGNITTTGLISLSAVHEINVNAAVTLLEGVSLTLTTTCGTSTFATCANTDGIYVKAGITLTTPTTAGVTAGNLTIMSSHLVEIAATTAGATGTATAITGDSASMVSITAGTSIALTSMDDTTPMTHNATISGGDISLTASDGNITSNNAGNTITSATGDISLTGTSGSIGASGTPIYLTQSTGATDDVTATAASSIYLRSTSELSLDAITAGSTTATATTIDIATITAVAHLNVNGAINTTTGATGTGTTTLASTDDIALASSGAITTTGTAVASIITLTANDNITSAGASNTITSSNGNITLIAGNTGTSGSIGASGTPIYLTQSTGATDDVTATAASSIYLRSTSELSLDAITAGSTTATATTIDIATITAVAHLNVNGAINTTTGATGTGTTTLASTDDIALASSGAITTTGTAAASIITLTANDNITSAGASNTITSSNGNITLIAGNTGTSGSIGASGTPIYLTQSTGATDDVTATAASSIYLRSTSELSGGDAITAGSTVPPLGQVPSTLLRITAD